MATTTGPRDCQLFRKHRSRDEHEVSPSEPRRHQAAAAGAPAGHVGDLMDEGQARDGPHPPFGQLESRVSSLAQNLEMRRLPGGACYKGGIHEKQTGVPHPKSYEAL